MRTFCATGVAVLVSLWVGCSVPAKSTLRIGITESAGATMPYLAEELNLFSQHGAHARVVELGDNEGLEHAFREGQVDAIVLPRSRAAILIKDRYSDAGVLLVLAIANNSGSSTHWQTAEEEVLLVRRSEVMHRRNEWSKLLRACEDARAEIEAHPDSIAALLALREHRQPEQTKSEISLWSFYGLAEQDSLLIARAELSELDARWQGNLGFTGAPAHERDGHQIAAQAPNKTYSR